MFRQPSNVCFGCGFEFRSCKCGLSQSGTEKKAKIVNKCEYTITSTVIDETIQKETDNLGEAFQWFAQKVSGAGPDTVIRVRGKYGDQIAMMYGTQSRG